MRSAPQKLRNHNNANQTNVVQSSPRTRVNRYIGRLIEARQTESDTADLNFLTLMYKCSEREQKVSQVYPLCLERIRLYKFTVQIKNRNSLDFFLFYLFNTDKIIRNPNSKLPFRGVLR